MLELSVDANLVSWIAKLSLFDVDLIAARLIRVTGIVSFRKMYIVCSWSRIKRCSTPLGKDNTELFKSFGAAIFLNDMLSTGAPRTTILNLFNPYVFYLIKG